jgi:excisionase family DNA binding protein
MNNVTEKAAPDINNSMLFTVDEVAAILKTNIDYVNKIRRAGLLRFLKVGRYKCRKETLIEFLEKYDGMDITDPNIITEVATEGGN